MNIRRTNCKTAALTLLEVLVVVLILVLLAAILLPVLANAKKKSSRINCINNLKQVGLVFQIWSGDNCDKYPMEVSVTNGGAMELSEMGNAFRVFEVMSNELSTPKVIYCPEDNERYYPTNGFGTGFSAKNISYFVGLDARTNLLKTILSGDSNLVFQDTPVGSGLLEIPIPKSIVWQNTPVGWTDKRHKRQTGNLVLQDGSVAWQLSYYALRQKFFETGLTTNRLAIP